MAKLKGILKIKGTLDDLTFYKSGKDYLVRTKGGVDGDRIANDPNFQRTRENGSEFGLAASAGKLLRTAIRNLLINAKDRYVTSRLTKVMTQIKNLDGSSNRGERIVAKGLEAPEASGLLNGFDFNINSILSSIFFAPYTVDAADGKIDIPSLVPINDLVAPSGATHFRTRGAWAKVDFANGTFDTKTSEAVTKIIDAEDSHIELTISEAPTGEGLNVHLLHLEFFQEVNGNLYSLKNGAYNSLSIVEVK